MTIPWKRLIPWAIGLLVVAALIWAFLPRPIPVDVAPVVTAPLRVTVDEEGRTRIKERYIVSAPLTGRLLRIDLDPGDPVVAGETVLATIEPLDPSLLDPRARAEAQLRVRAAEAALRRADPQVAAAVAALEFAQSELRRTREAASRGAATEDELEEAILLERTRTEELRAAQFAQEIARYELQLARAALLQTERAPDNGDAEDDEAANGEAGGGDAEDGGSGVDPSTDPEALAGELPRFEITSPITGRVLRVPQESAAVVTPGTPLIELGDPRDLEIEVDVLSRDAVRINPGDRVLLEHWGGDHPIEGVVRLVEPSGFTKISALGVEEQRVNAIIDFAGDPPPTLGDAFRVEARIVVWEAPDVLQVPNGALFRSGGEWAVYAIADGRATLRTIRIGQRNELATQILEGLSEGDAVILHPSDQIAPGVRVTPRPDERRTPAAS